MSTSKIYSSPDVTKGTASPALSEPTFTDIRGTIQRLDLGGKKLNVLFTKAGFMRSGDLHQNTQFDFIFSGKIELWLRKDEKDEKIVYGPNSFIEIPPDVPHLFNFLEDTLMSEWWDGPFEAWYYKPYRDIIDKTFRELTETK